MQEFGFASPDNYMYDEEFSKTNPFPHYLFTSEFNIDSLRNLRKDWHTLRAGMLDIEAADRLDRDIESRFWTYAQSFIDERPFHFFVTIRITFMRDFLFIKDSFSPFKQNTIAFKSLRAHFFLSYYILLFGFILGIISLLWARNKEGSIVLLTAFLFMMFHVAMGRVENRYLLPVIPLFAIGLAVFMGSVSEKYRNRFVK